MGFAFLPIGIGSLIGGWFGGKLMHQYTEVTHQPAIDLVDRGGRRHRHHSAIVAV